jgi:steroid 5-alpha reductase family enzyme
VELYNSAKKKYEKIPDDPRYKALTKIFDANLTLKEALRFLNFHALAVRAGEISEAEAIQRLSGYPNQKALALAGAIGCAIFEQEMETANA